MRRFGVKDPQGLAVDPVTGDLFILDAAGPRLVRISPAAGARLANGAVTVMDLNASGMTAPRGIAIDPSTSHLHVLSPGQMKLYELENTGALVAVRDLASFSLKNPQAMVFAPSGDQTDDPAIQSLYIADSGTSASPSVTAATASQPTGEIVEFTLIPNAALPPGTSLLSASLVNIIDTSKASWNPSAPDPAGLDYWPLTGRLLISDSEVDEMSIYFQGKNIFQSSLSGNLGPTCSTISYTHEPTGVAINPNNNHIFISDDAPKDKVFEVSLGPDGVYCTGDDTVTTTLVNALYGATDAEDVGYGDNKLFIAGGADAEVFVIPLGANGVLGGGDDGPMTHFDTKSLGFNDLEGITYNPANGTLFIVSTKGTDRYLGEVTLNGNLVRAYDLSLMGSAGNIRSDVAIGPGSQNASVQNIYIASRGVDNDSNRQENDGRVWEIHLASTGGGGSPTPTHTPTRTPTPSGPTNTPTVTFTPSPTSTPGGPDLIFADNFESGDFSAWTANKTDSGDLSVSPAAAMQGALGMQAVLDDTVSIFLTDDMPNAETRYRARFYFAPNSLNMADGNAFFIFNAFMNTSTAVGRVEFRSSGGAYQVRARVMNDAGSWTNTAWFTISNGPHPLEIDWRAATAAGANNGGITLWIDGVQQADISNVDNDTHRVDRARLGAVAGLDAGISGTCFFDDFVSGRQNYIGP